MVKNGKGFKNREKPNNESITFRLDTDTIARIKKEAADKEIGLNTLLSQMIKHYIKWHSIGSSAGYVFVRRSLLTKLLENLTEDEVLSISESVAKSSNRDTLMVFRNKVDTDSAVDLIETWLRISDIPFRHENSDRRHSFVIQHGMGRKWSLYMGEIYRYMLRECNIGRVEYDARDKTLSLVFDVPPDKVLT